MKEIKPPKIEPMGKARIAVSDFERFARAYFGIQLTSYQLEVVEMMAGGKNISLKHKQRNQNQQKEQAIEIALKYLREGIKPYGRARLPQMELPAHIGKTKLKAKSQNGRVLEMIKRTGGAFNFELSRISLRYGGTIFDLRKDGHNIVTERQYLKNGKASNTFLYRIAGEL